MELSLFAIATGLLFRTDFVVPFPYHNNVSSYDKNFDPSSKNIDMYDTNQDEVHSSWKNYVDSIKRKTLSVVFKLSIEEVAGGEMHLPNGTILALDGGGVSVFWDLKSFLNLTVEYVFSKDWEESWTLVENGNVELGIPLRTMSGRLGSLNTTSLLYPLLSMSSNVYFRPPPALVTTMHSLIFWPLQYESWIVLSLLWGICVFACYSIQNVQKYRNLHTEPLMTEVQVILLSDIILWAVAIVSGKEYPVPRKEPGASKVSTSLRISMLSAMCLSVIILAVYTAKIMTFFSAKTTVIKTPEDLLKYKYTLSTYSPVHMERIFKDLGNKPDIVQQAVNNFHGGDDAMKRLLAVGNPDPRFAFLTHPDGFYMHANFQGQHFVDITSSDELCDVSSFSSAFKSPRSMYIKKGSKFREILNWKILQIVESGINFRYQRAHNKKFEFTCYRGKQPFFELTIHQTLSLFSLLLTGASFAVLIYFIEWIHSKLKRKI